MNLMRFAAAAERRQGAERDVRIAGIIRRDSLSGRFPLHHVFSVFLALFSRRSYTCTNSTFFLSPFMTIRYYFDL